ncbi:MAG: hypothetical protein U9R48_01920 [Chloroflexota bacterium]|nr:hypothetical protein [Chloroflexota bacterium]
MASHETTLTLDTPMAPPHWALLERELLRANSQACEVFFDHYFDHRGYLLCVPRWGGDDGADDAIENLAHWPTLHALGGADKILDMYKLAWEGHLQQYTEAKTEEVPFARDGMYYKEFPVMFDWLHNGESMSVFNLQGLSDPRDPDFQKRVKRYAAFYTGEDPDAPNYDPEHRLMRSMFNGSRGPLMRKTTGLDWAGDPFEATRFDLLHGERNYEEIVAHFKDYNDVVGDSPLNLGATSLAFNAYALTGEAKYKDWLLEYADAWIERTEANGGIIPSNVGLDGTIGGACDGKWYGGVYGWGFSVEVPQTGELAHRNTAVGYHPPYGFGNALLMTGDQRYVDVWRGVLEAVNANGKEIDGQMMYPHMYGDEGWYHYMPERFSPGALEVYYWSMDDADLERLPMGGWIAYLKGEEPDYPVESMQQDLVDIRRKVKEGVYEDTATPDTRLSDNPNPYNPATVGTLVKLMLGGLPTGRAGFPLHCRVRYFDPQKRRAGMPDDVGALVDEMTADEMALTLVNVNQVQERTVVVQGGAYAEHQIEEIKVGDQVVPVDDSAFSVRLAPGAGRRLVLKMARYANQPTFAFPWA